jgi:hypothetical protein
VSTNSSKKGAERLVRHLLACREYHPPSQYEDVCRSSLEPWYIVRNISVPDEGSNSTVYGVLELLASPLDNGGSFSRLHILQIGNLPLEQGTVVHDSWVAPILTRTIPGLHSQTSTLISRKNALDMRRIQFQRAMRALEFGNADFYAEIANENNGALEDDWAEITFPIAVSHTTMEKRIGHKLLRYAYGVSTGFTDEEEQLSKQEPLFAPHIGEPHSLEDAIVEAAERMIPSLVTGEEAFYIVRKDRYIVLEQLAHKVHGQTVINCYIGMDDKAMDLQDGDILSPGMVEEYRKRHEVIRWLGVKVASSVVRVRQAQLTGGAIRQDQGLPLDACTYDRTWGSWIKTRVRDDMCPQVVAYLKKIYDIRDQKLVPLISEAEGR